MKNAFLQLVDMLKELLVSAVMSNMTSLFSMVNDEVSSVASQVGQNPQDFSPSVFAVIKNLSDICFRKIHQRGKSYPVFLQNSMH